MDLFLNSIDFGERKNSIFRIHRNAKILIKTTERFRFGKIRTVQNFAKQNIFNLFVNSFIFDFNVNYSILLL